MTWFLDSLTNFTMWLFYTSLKATILIAIILMIQRVLHKKLSAKWQHALWFLLIARLLIPFEIPAPFSIFNVTKNMETVIPLEELTRKNSTEVIRGSAILGPGNEASYRYRTLIEADVNVIKSAKISFGEIASTIWILVVLGLSLTLFYSNIKIKRKL